MWELISANRRKSFFLFVIMGTCLILLGYFIGAAYYPQGGGFIGIGIAFFIWMMLSVISYFSGDSILLAVSGAREVTPDVHQQLFNVVEEMKIAAGLPAMPKVYIIDSPAPNAFATGRKPENCAIAVTAGLLSRLNRDELQGVVAHETSHILNRDIQFMTFAGVMLGSIVLISQVFVRGLWFSGGGSRYRGRSRDSGQGAAIFMIVAIVFAILAPIFAQLLFLAISRRREYLADATGARLTRYPEGLASALEKIASSPEKLQTANDATAGLYIINPLQANRSDWSAWTSTHPPIAERIAILRALSQGASLVDYQNAFNKIRGKKDTVIPDSGLKDATPVPLRTAGAPLEKGAGAQKRELGDLIRAVNGFLFLTCACGLKIKIPPDFKKESIACPRCGRENKVPSAELATLAGVGAIISKDVPGMSKDGPTSIYKRRGTGWETFNCSCGRPIQLSPQFQGNEVTCPSCGKKTLIQQ
ncbi:Protease HtpX homolog [Candidatus Zixiibacteriota bacterium]|nr:Protease HtpX homolog [candidate division Zixibacteria bacterium]